MSLSPKLEKSDDSNPSRSQDPSGDVQGSQVPMQDDQLRKVLDDIDLKIGQAIEEKEAKNEKLKLLYSHTREAKDSFTQAYK